jgi:hypothetical protein
VNAAHRARRMIRPLVLALVFTGALAVSVASNAQAATPFCGIHWGSLGKSLDRMTSAPITNVRTGRHACFDRLVVDLRGKGANYSVHYVDAVLNQGQGAPIPLRGGARLEIVVKAPDHDINTGVQTYHFGNPTELSNVTGFSTFRQVAWGGSFEGYTTIGLGVRARLPMRAFILDGPHGGSRVVIDVAHHWWQAGTTASPPSSVPTLGQRAGDFARGQGFGQVNPSEVFNGGDPTGLVTRIVWHSWGGPESVGAGISTYVGPNQIVAQGTQQSATIVAFDLGTCDGKLMYRAVEWYFPQHGQIFDPNAYENICTGSYVGNR